MRNRSTLVQHSLAQANCALFAYPSGYFASYCTGSCPSETFGIEYYDDG